MSTKSHPILFLLGIALLAGCGDTELGSPDDGPEPPEIPANNVALEVANADDALGLVAVSFDEVDDAKDLAFDSLEDITAVVAASAQQTLAAAKRVTPADAQFTFSGASGTFYCGGTPSSDTGDGKLEWAFTDDNDNDELDDDDTITLTWTDCEAANTVTLDGKLTLTEYSATGANDLEVGNGSASFRASFDSLNITSSGETVSEVGLDGNISYTLSSNNGVITTTVASTSLVIRAEDEELEFISYNSTTTYTVATTAYSTQITAEIASTDISGAVEITTPTAISGQLNVSSGRPSAGSIKIEGENSSVTATIESASSIQVDVDLNGDGTADTSFDTTWTELLEQAAN
jgi:hypothetical protein